MFHKLVFELWSKEVLVTLANKRKTKKQLPRGFNKYFMLFKNVSAFSFSCNFNKSF